MPYYIARAVLAMATVVPFVLTVAGEQPWGAVGIGLLGFATLAGFTEGASLPAATATGASVAAPWLGLKARINQARKLDEHINYDVLLPYIKAMNQFGALQEKIEAASADGYVLLAFRHSLQSDAWTGGFYPSVAFLAATSSPSSAGGSGVSAGGAAAGGSGASGSA